jgi:hypothetical protein
MAASRLSFHGKFFFPENYISWGNKILGKAGIKMSSPGISRDPGKKFYFELHKQLKKT